ncbi:MAG: UDP-N-acetylmuramoyl-tripeptide--D-alanyl-D-alanine ligase [Lentisphaeria bacterium]|nr:UDP-N-acetylmuramoyl-tripeptide--D-alanyl-D-alanine ligase [Lentisphaeria bacterium]
MNLSCADIVKVVGAEIKNSASTANLSFQSVLTDSRVDLSNALFVALKGENFDAHNFLDKAVEAGASALCINRNTPIELYKNIGVPVLLVPDTLLAYQQIANFHRRSFANLIVVGITGSVGKTSTKEIMKAVAVKKFGEEAVLYTLGNTNNQVGVPQNLLRLSENHRIAIIEMGTNHFGEIRPLSLCAEPDYAIINSVAPCHLENLINLEGVAKEKSDIFVGVKAGGYAIFANNIAEKSILIEKATAYSLKIESYGEYDENNYFSANYVSGNLLESKFDLINHKNSTKTQVTWQISGEHQACNASGAAVVGSLLGLSDSEIAEALANASLSGMRMRKTSLNGVTYLNDAYNANPASMKATLKNLKDIAENKKLILILGDMLELGSSEIAQHAEILDYAVENFPSAVVIAVGKLMKQAGLNKNFANVIYVDNSVIAGERLSNYICDGSDTLVFLKGSRGMRLENAIPEEAR